MVATRSDVDSSNFGEELQYALNERGMKQAAAARQLGVSGAAVSSWVTGTSRPSPENTIRLEDLLDVRPRGRWLKMLGYAAPGDSEPMTVEDHIRADPTISLDDKRVLLRFLERVRQDSD